MTSAPGKGSQPTPALLFETLRGYQHAFALKTAVELDLFTTIAKTKGTLPEIAKSCAVPERSARILCDHFAVVGFLSKNNGAYRLTPDSAAFLDSRSPAYMGKAVNFLLHANQFQNFQQLTETIRKGVPAKDGFEPDDPMWVEFARGMAPMMFPAAQAMAQYLKPHLAGAAAQGPRYCGQPRRIRHRHRSAKFQSADLRAGLGERATDS